MDQHGPRCTDILNNELYIGRRVWNRQRHVKDPSTGKRVPRLNPRDEWIVTQVPQLRIVPDDLWQAAMAARHATAIEAAREHHRRNRLNALHRPKSLAFSIAAVVALSCAAQDALPARRISATAPVPTAAPSAAPSWFKYKKYRTEATSYTFWKLSPTHAQATIPFVNISSSSWQYNSIAPQYLEGSCRRQLRKQSSISWRRPV